MKDRRKIFIFGVIVIFLLGIICALFLIINIFNRNNTSSSSSNNEEYVEQAESLKNSLLEFANNQIDDEGGLDKKDEKYDVNKIASINIDTNMFSYTTYNEKYVFSISMELNNMEDIEYSIKHHGYSNLEIKEKEVVTSETNPLLLDGDFLTNIKDNKYVSILNKTNDVYRYIDMTYLGKDDKYYSLCSYQYKTGEFNIEGVEENLYSVGIEKPILFNLLKMMTD